MRAKKEQPEESAGARRAPDTSRQAEAAVPPGAGLRSLAPMQRAVGNAAVARMVQRQRDADEDDRPVQRSTVPDVLRSPGRPLAEPVRAEMEQRLGADFSDVRVHEGVAAQRSAAEVGARAYTSGHHVVIGDGGGDRHTLAHELAHVVQQRSGPVSGTDNGSGLSVSDPADRFEREAEATARRVMSGPPTTAAAPEGAVQRARGTAVQRMTNEEAEGATASSSSSSSSSSVDPLTAFAAATYTPGAGGSVGTVADGPRAATLREIAWEDHWAPIAEVCRKYHYTIAVRETGTYSIKRLAEGAKPKPHTILEKSIKPGSVKKAHGAESDQVLEWLAKEDLDGFVGHWGDAGLEGVRIDNPPQSVLDLGIVQTGTGGIQFVPITLLQPGGGAALTTLKTAVPNWKTLLYTGDYDLHEAYSWMGAMGGGGQVAEASQEKVNLLNRLNAGVAASSEDPVKRSGTAAMGAHGLHMEDGSEYAMFQHGDQATYRMNQYLEAQAAQLQPMVAQLVKAVATESDEPMGWCRWGQWYVTMNKAEHAALRAKWGLVTPNTWSDEAVKRTEAHPKGYKTAKYI